MKNVSNKRVSNSPLALAEGLHEALIELKRVTKKQVEPEFINPFITATLKVLEIQAQVSAAPEKVVLRQVSDKFLGDTSAFIRVEAETFNGSLVLSFPKDTFLRITSNMLGEPFTELNQEISDGAGEMMNMIFGHAKVTLNEQGHGVKLALPSVITGKNQSMASLTKGPNVVIPFRSDVGNFLVEICLAS